jgi:phosphoribosyl 1,2-cyclic phosphodiesterase
VPPIQTCAAPGTDAPCRYNARVLTCSLQSGSNGNCIYVEAGDQRLLFDAGISGLQTRQRLASHGRDLRTVTAVIISHDHSDHIGCVGVFDRRYQLPIYLTRATHDRVRHRVGALRRVKHFVSGQTLEFGPVRVYTVKTPHDAVDGVAFIVEHEGRRLGIMTDLGHPFAELTEIVGQVDAAYLESNYDPEMLADGPYPPLLQERIRGPGGHLSNEEAARLLRDSHGGSLFRTRRGPSWIALAHLSEENNSPELALDTHRKLLGRSFPLHVAGRYEVGPMWEV